MKRIAFVVALVLLLSACGSSSEPSESVEANAAPEKPTIEFSGESYTAKYRECLTPVGVTGCIGLILEIENKGDVEEVYNLAKVYVDDTACNTGSGVPIVAASGKKANGAFLVFTETPLEEINKIEFVLEIRDNASFNLIESSDTITVNL